MLSRAVLCAAVCLTACASQVGSASGDASVGLPRADSGVALADGGVAPDADLAHRERCNGLDDDGDGRTDEGCPIRLTRDPRHDVYPSISGHTVAWARIEQQFMGDVGEVYVRTLPDGVERRVATGVAYPRIAGHRVSYLRDGHLALLDLDTGVEQTIATPDASFVQSPFLTERYIGWSQLQRDSDEDYEVYVMDLETGRRMRVGRDPAVQQFPLIEGDAVAWSDDRRGHHTVGLLHLTDIYAASLVPAMDTIPARQISDREGTDTVYDYPTALDQNRVLVAEWHGPVASPEAPRRCVPVLFDVATRARTALAEETPECFAPGTLAGSRAVLVFDPDGVSDLYLVDVPTGRRTRLTTYNRRSARPRLSRDGTLLVWQDDRNEDWELYYMDLTDADRGDLSPEGVTP